MGIGTLKFDVWKSSWCYGRVGVVVVVVLRPRHGGVWKSSLCYGRLVGENVGEKRARGRASERAGEKGWGGKERKEKEVWRDIGTEIRGARFDGGRMGWREAQNAVSE